MISMIAIGHFLTLVAKLTHIHSTLAFWIPSRTVSEIQIPDTESGVSPRAELLAKRPSIRTCSGRFHRGIVFAVARGPVASGSMIQSLLS
jgi:hypothetical protein